MLKASAIVLAGGSSSRFGVDKGLLMLDKKPLVRHVLENVDGLVDQKVVVVSSEAQASSYSRSLGARVDIQLDAERIQTPLNGAATGLEKAQGAYSLLLACDTPFVSKEVLSLLLELSTGKAAVIPRWPDCQIEPLQAIYCTEPALEAARGALNEGKLNMQAMINKLHGIRYVSTLVLQQLDPELRTFFNINTPMDLKKAEFMMGKQK
jgi:molybdopterin-guanine dinucleotide biosynthesis protein A